ncbi:hypothetical protein [Zhihengliuella halotolerans]|uniref:hypothetical protein n=1 Tax=Zhihengliuella halotolerans TaxID=370736 RepID=UPI000C7FB7D6|nr:hypothetical protein [Zhihengliuella halotolerans]
MAYSVDTSTFDDWADPSAIRAAAKDLKKKADAVEDDVDTCHTTWTALTSHLTIDDAGASSTFKNTYKDIKKHGEFVGSGGEKAKTALDGFADAIDELLPMVENLTGQIANFEIEANKIDTSDSLAVSEANRAERGFKLMVSGMQTSYDNAEKKCANELNTIYDKVHDEGGAIAGPWGTAALTAIGGAPALVHIDPNRKIPVYGYKTPKYDPTKYYTTKTITMSNGQVKNVAYLKPGAVLPAPERYIVRHQQPWSIIDPKEAQKQGIKPHKILRYGNPLVTVVGGLITFNSEYEKRYNELLRTNPELTQDELENESGQAAAVRGTSKTAVILAAGATGMAIGTAIPGVGNVVGGVIGLGIGAGIAFGAEISGLNDWVADRAEDLYQAVTPEPVKKVVGEIGEFGSKVGGAISDGWNSLWD